MKRWYITVGELEFRCSMLSLSGKAKVLSLKSDFGDVLHFQFMKFFDFARAKTGFQQSGWIKLFEEENKMRGKIIFK